MELGEDEGLRLSEMETQASSAWPGFIRQDALFFSCIVRAVTVLQKLEMAI